MGLQSSQFRIVPEIATTPTTNAILSKDIQFIASERDIVSTSPNTQVVLNGKSATVRVWFSLNTGGDYQLTFTKLGGQDFSKPLIVNGDNSFILKSVGYYRFDIGVKVDDLLNFKSSVSVPTDEDVFELLIQQIQLGA